ncbi:MAG TPA: Ig-like domain-containing protein [Candidatus Saccharimonadia bacterium]|nr:Ig-like domain-containing protein [Candidatus Saccharimonadia bacterium]
MVSLRYSHHRHTGRLRPHHETSYALLVFVLVLCGLLLGAYSVTATAANTTGGGQYTVGAVVNGPRPVKPAIITSPVNGQVFQTNPITVVGTCQPATLVKVFKNGILAGSVLCDASGHFSLQIDLVIGQNALTAVSYNANDQAGPESPAVNVTLVAPAGGLGFSTELIIQSTSYYRGVQPGEQVVWPIELVGGQSPYAVSVDWGDGTSDLLTRLAPGPFTASHVYRKIGTGYLNSFPLIIRATDAAGHTAYLQLTTIVSQSTAASSTAQPAKKTFDLVMLWPIWIVLLLMVVSFWLGERREKAVMRRQFEAVA